MAWARRDFPSGVIGVTPPLPGSSGFGGRFASGCFFFFSTIGGFRSNDCARAKKKGGGLETAGKNV
jgi:hypothetical protein